MFTLIQRVSCFERQMDTRMEKFIVHHPFWGMFLIFIGLPLVTLAAVCVRTIIAALFMAFLFGWV